MEIKKRKLTKRMIEKAHKMYISDERYITNEEIGRELGVSSAMISHLAKQHGWMRTISIPTFVEKHGTTFAEREEAKVKAITGILGIPTMRDEYDISKSD